MFGKQRTLAAAIVFFCSVCLQSQVGGGSGASEYSVKAAFLYQFSLFIDWPSDAFANPSAPLIIGVLGDDPFGSTLDKTVKDKTVNGRRFVVKRFESLEDLQYCHILFVSSSEDGHLSRVLEKLKSSSTVTVSDIHHFAKQGGIIGFVIRDNRIGLQINAAAAKEARVKISSKLLRLADVI